MTWAYLFLLSFLISDSCNISDEETLIEEQSFNNKKYSSYNTNSTLCTTFSELKTYFDLDNEPKMSNKFAITLNENLDNILKNTNEYTAEVDSIAEIFANIIKIIPKTSSNAEIFIYSPDKILDFIKDKGLYNNKVIKNQLFREYKTFDKKKAKTYYNFYNKLKKLVNIENSTEIRSYEEETEELSTKNATNEEISELSSESNHNNCREHSESDKETPKQGSISLASISTLLLNNSGERLTESTIKSFDENLTCFFNEQSAVSEENLLVLSEIFEGLINKIPKTTEKVKEYTLSLNKILQIIESQNLLSNENFRNKLKECLDNFDKTKSKTYKEFYTKFFNLIAASNTITSVEKNSDESYQIASNDEKNLKSAIPNKYSDKLNQEKGKSVNVTAKVEPEKINETFVNKVFQKPGEKGEILHHNEENSEVPKNSNNEPKLNPLKKFLDENSKSITKLDDKARKIIVEQVYFLLNNDTCNKEDRAIVEEFYKFILGKLPKNKPKYYNDIVKDNHSFGGSLEDFILYIKQNYKDLLQSGNPNAINLFTTGKYSELKKIIE